MHYGFKASEVKNLFPNLVVTDENGIMSVNYVEMIPLLIELIKEQERKIEELEKKVANLKK